MILNARKQTMWNRITGPKGFDTDATLPYRERLIVCYLHEGKTKSGEAYVDNGIWHWWDNAKVIDEDCKIIVWTPFPFEVE